MKIYQQLICSLLSLSFCIVILVITLFTLSAFNLSELSKQEYLSRIKYYETSLKKRGFTDREMQDMSPLGKWLLAPEGSPPPINIRKNRTFFILFWLWLPPVTSSNITWENCSVNNCILSDNHTLADRADAVVGLLYRPWALPKFRPGQRFIFMSERHPAGNLLNPNVSSFDGMYNWSMTYRMNSDIPIPYGRTIERSQPASQDFSQRWRNDLKTTKTKLIATWDNDCWYCDHTQKTHYIMKLKELLQDDMDIGGKCWPDDSTFCLTKGWDCPALNAYKFYLALEQCRCHEYISKQIFRNAYQKNAVPIILGPSKEDCRRLLPPNSFLHVDDFKNISALAAFVKELDRDDEKYMRYHEWRDRYTVLVEHRESDYYCRICEALNYNPTTPKIYTNIESFWHREHCL